MNEQGHICFASNTTIGRKIREARRKMNMTQAELKDKLAAYGVQIQTPRITKWELGGNMPSVYQLFALCYALDIANGLSYFTGIHSEPDR